MRLPGSSFIHITTVAMTGGHEAVKALVRNVTNANNLRSTPPRCLHLDLGGLLHSPSFLEAAAFSETAQVYSPSNKPGVDNGGAPIPRRVQVLRDAGRSRSRKFAYRGRPYRRVTWTGL